MIFYKRQPIFYTNRNLLGIQNAQLPSHFTKSFSTIRIRGYSSSIQNNFLLLQKLSYFSPSKLVSARWATSHSHVFSPDYWVSNWTLASFTLHGITHWRPSYLGMSHHKCEATLQCKSRWSTYHPNFGTWNTDIYYLSPSNSQPSSITPSWLAR